MPALLFGAPHQYEPHSNNRFILEFPTDIGIQTFQVLSVGGPGITMDTQEMNFINTTTYVNTHFKWESMDITIREFIYPSSIQAVMEWVRLCAESVTGRMGYAVGYLKDLYIRRLDPLGAPVSSWKLEKCLVKTVKGSDLSMDSFDVSTITMTIQPQRCILIN